MLTLKNGLISFLSIAALSLSGWSIFVSNLSTSTTKNNPNQPDAFMENVVATTLNKQGSPTIKLITPKMVHYAANDATDISTPRVTVYRNSPNPWYINSDYAKATAGINQIIFWSNVVIHHVADVANPTTTMLTTSLTVFPKTRLAKTSEPVTITQPDTIVHAIGMLANLDAGTVKLLSKAQGEYVPS